MSIKIYGRNPSLEILNTNKKVFNVFIMENTNDDILRIVRQKKLSLQILNKHNFKKTFLGNHQGVVLEIEDYKTYSLNDFLSEIDKSKNPLLLILDGITDPHNFGAIIRSAEAGGVAGIIIPKKRSVSITGTVAKVSSGAIEYVKIIEVSNLRNTLEILKKEGFWTVGTDLSATKSHHEIDVLTPLAIVIGSEDKGISKIIKDNVDYNVKIDMVGKINSLNASVSAGILIFDILRKKQ